MRRIGWIGCCALVVGGFACRGSDTPLNNNNNNNNNNNMNMPPAQVGSCDGFSAADSMNNAVLVQTYAFGEALKAQGCGTMLDALADGTKVQSVTGIYDLDVGDNGAPSPAAALFPGHCSDLGMGSAPAAGTFSPAQGASTIAAAYGNASASDIFGVVTAVAAWGVDAADGSTHGGTIYLQDPSPADGSAPPAKTGVQVYFPKADAMSYGTAPSVGDVVHVTGVKWSPYKGVNQFSASSTTKVTKLGTSALPTPVSLHAADVGASSNIATSGYEGMRVTIAGAPLTVNGSKTSKTCPLGLQFVKSMPMMNPMMNTMAYCDGLAVKDASSNQVYVQYYVFGTELKAEGCSTMIEGYQDGAMIQQVSGVYDLDTSDNGAAMPSPAIFPGSCSDMGIGTPPGGGQAITPPQGASTIAAAYGNTSVSTIYGVVTAVYGWGLDKNGMPHSGTVYLQDATPNGAMPVPKSGAQIYFSKTNAMTYGTVPSVGDVVEVTGVKWSPFKGVNQFSTSAMTMVTKLGTSALPTPILVHANDVGPSSNVSMNGYEGMRVSVMGGPFTVSGSKGSNTCPQALQYASQSGNGG